MVNVSYLVEKIVEQKPFLQEALNKGIINQAALAEQLIPEIEKELKKKVKFSAVNMAIRRLSEKLKTTFIEKAKFDRTTDLNIRSDLIEIVIYKVDNLKNKIKNIYDLVDFRKGDFLTITQGLNELMIITNERNEDEITGLFSEEMIKRKINNLASISINIPEESVDTIGLFYIVTRALNWENINVIDIVSTFTEMTFILKEEDIARAYDKLREIINKNK